MRRGDELRRTVVICGLAEGLRRDMASKSDAAKLRHATRRSIQAEARRRAASIIRDYTNAYMLRVGSGYHGTSQDYQELEYEIKQVAIRLEAEADKLWPI